ncbi:hypothetical protein O181_108057, partial [Austropuccinia psidii MF-1]|nr:hypothetical protein [Austropuccinia psidii MF-1]
MEDTRASTSFQRLASTFDTLIEIPEADITAIAVRPESLSTGNNRDIPVSVQELVYCSKEERVGTSPKSLDRHHELISSSGEIHGARKDRGTSEGLDTHVLQRKSPTDKSLVEIPKHVIRGPEEVGPRQGKQPSGPPQASTSKIPPQQVPNKPKQTPKTNQKGKQKGKGKEKPKWNKPYLHNYRIPKKEKKAMDNVFNMERTLMELKNKEDERLSQSFPRKQLKDSRIQVQNLENSTGNNAALFQEQLEKSDKARIELKEDIQSSINNISLKNEFPRQSTPILDRNVLNLNNDLHHTVSSNAELETACNFQDIPILEEWPTFSGEGEYNNMEFMKKIDNLKEDFNIPDEYISSRLHSLFTKSAKKWYNKIRQDHGKHSWPWWKEQTTSKWENDSGRLKMENSFEEAIFNIERDRPVPWFLKQKDRLTAVHSDMSETLKLVLIPSGKPIPKPNKPHDKAPLKCHKCGSTSHLANTFPKKTRINEIEIVKDDTKETKDVSVHESDSEPCEEEELPGELSIENINVSFEFTEVHTHLPQYSDECMDLIHLQYAKMQKAKPARGKGYTAGSSCITNIVINNTEAKIHLDSGSFCTCFGKDYLDKIYTNWKDKLMPIEGIKFSSSSQNMHPLGIFEAAMIFPHPTGSIRLKVEFVVMNNCTSQHFILGNDYLNIYGIDINNHKD